MLEEKKKECKLRQAKCCQTCYYFETYEENCREFLNKMGKEEE